MIVVNGCDSLIDEYKYFETIAYSAYLERKNMFQFFFRKRVITQVSKKNDRQLSSKYPVSTMIIDYYSAINKYLLHKLFLKSV